MTRVVFASALLSACATGGRADTILALTGDDIAGRDALRRPLRPSATRPTARAAPARTSPARWWAPGVVNTVLNGEGQMPSFSTLSDQEVADLLAWLDANVFG